NGITASASAADGPDASGSAGPSPAEPGPSASAGGRQASSGRPETSEAPGAGGVAANDILDRAERAYAQLRSMEADFVQQVYVPLLERTIDSRGKIFHRAPDRFLMRFSEPAGDVVVADGRYVWMYYPSNDPIQVMRSPLTEGGQQADLQREFLSDATERYRATRTGSENVGGRQTHALTLVPRSASPYQEIRIWVDAQDSLVRRFEITEQNGSVRRLEMRNLRPNVPLGDDLFEFTPPPNAQVIEP
ncbi:MAG: outer membrane lipoprotein carrier protein LolA, partial [Gemmatimonadota bacterium]